MQATTVDKAMDIREKEERRRRRRRRRRSQDKVLHQKLRNLEHDWDSFKQTHPCATLRRWSIDHSKTNITSSSNTVNSPRSLMTSPQKYHRSSPNSEAMEEILPRGPKAAIEMCRFGALMELEGGTEMGLGEREERSSSVFCNYNANSHDGNENCAGKEEEVALANCGFEYCSNSSVFSLSDDEKMKKEELVAIERGGIGGDIGCRSSKNGRRWSMLFMGWSSVFLLMVLILGFISLRCSRAEFGDEDEVKLLPT